MTTFSEVDPDNTSTIYPSDASTPPQRYAEGATLLTTHGGGDIQRLFSEPRPDLNVYLEDDQRTPAPDFYRATTEARVFSGTLGDAAARVIVTSEHTRISLADLYDRKTAEVGDQDNRVRYNTADTSLASSWWIVITEKAQQELLWVATGSNSRELRSQSWPSGPNTPVLAIYNANNGNVRREAITNQATWDIIEQEIALHLQATSNATKASGTALEALNDDAQAALDAAGGDVNDPAYQAAWDAVAAHDAADPAWGYPPIVELSATAQALLGD